MKIYIDQKAVQRNAIVGKILRWVSLGCMLVGLLAVFSQQIFENPSLFSIFSSIMIVGVVLSSVSSFFTNRYGRSPRPDEIVDKSFKGLDDRYRLFHYRSSIPHLMSGPSGLWTIIPTFVDGEIAFDERKNNWIHKKNTFLNRFLSKEYFPNPTVELRNHQKELDKITKTKNTNKKSKLKILVILMNKNIRLSGIAESEDVLILPFEKVKDRFRKLAKNNDQSSFISDSVFVDLQI